MFSGVDKTVEALLHGQDCANHLKMQLENHETRSLQTEVLVENVLDSFSIALSFFMSITSRHHESSSQNMSSKSLKRCQFMSTLKNHITQFARCLAFELFDVAERVVEKKV